MYHIKPCQFVDLLLWNLFVAKAFLFFLILSLVLNKSNWPQCLAQFCSRGERSVQSVRPCWSWLSQCGQHTPNLSYWYDDEYYTSPYYSKSPVNISWKCLIDYLWSERLKSHVDTTKGWQVSWTRVQGRRMSYILYFRDINHNLGIYIPYTESWRCMNSSHIRMIS